MIKITIELAGRHVPVTVTEYWPAHEGGLHEPPADEYFEWKFDDSHDQMMAMVDEFLLKDAIEEKISKELASEEDYEP